MTTVAISVEGVLRRPYGGQPIREGIDLYYGLASRAKVILVTEQLDAHVPGNDTELETWLMIEGMNEHAQIIYQQVVWLHEPDKRILWQVNMARSSGHDVTLVIDADPRVSAMLLEAGYNVLTFSHAEYSIPIWRPDYEHKPAPWDDLISRVEHEALLRAKDARRDNEEK